MKMKKEHLVILKKEIDAVIKRYGKQRLIDEYETGDFLAADKTKDLQRRFCFDLLFCAELNTFVPDSLYPYLNDDHIYTALKSICPKVTRRY